jgi:hypothetical protein
LDNVEVELGEDEYGFEACFREDSIRRVGVNDMRLAVVDV